MQQSSRWLVLVLISVGMLLAACQQQSEQLPEQLPQRESAFTAQHAGPAFYRVRLTQKAADKYNLKTDVIRQEQVSGILRRVVPEAAVVYDQQGDAWVFTSPEPLVFIRTRVTVDQIDGGLAVLSDGPTAGTTVVTAGANELFSSGNDEGRIESKAEAGHSQANAAATATMLEDGTIKVVHKTTGATGFTANIVIEYKPGDEEYQKVLDQVGGLQPGETKSLSAAPEL